MTNINKLDLLKDKMKNLKEELNHIVIEKTELKIANHKKGQTNKCNTLGLKSFRNGLLIEMKNIALLKEELNRWKGMAEQLKNLKQIQTLFDQVTKQNWISSLKPMKMLDQRKESVN